MKFEQSADAKAISSVFFEVEMGGVVTFDELSKAIGRDVRAHALGAIQTARRRMLNDHGRVFENVRNVGYKRLADADIVRASESDRRRLLRGAKRSVKKLSCVAFEKLSDDERRQHTAAAAQLGAVAMFASASASKKIESAVSKTTSSDGLPIGKTLALFS